MWLRLQGHSLVQPLRVVHVQEPLHAVRHPVRVRCSRWLRRPRRRPDGRFLGLEPRLWYVEMRCAGGVMRLLIGLRAQPWWIRYQRASSRRQYLGSWDWVGRQFRVRGRCRFGKHLPAAGRWIRHCSRSNFGGRMCARGTRDRLN